MSGIPTHFHRLFKSIVTVDQYFSQQLQDYDNTEKRNTTFMKFCHDTLIAKPNDVKSDLYEEWKDHTRNAKSSSTENSDPTIVLILDSLVAFLTSDYSRQKHALLTGYKKVAPIF